MVGHYIPDRGDLIWLEFNPQVGHEQVGYNGKIGLALMCPITKQIKGYPLEVKLPSGLGVSGVVLADQIKSLDWRARKAEFICKVPENVVAEIQERIHVLID